MFKVKLYNGIVYELFSSDQYTPYLSEKPKIKTLNDNTLCVSTTIYLDTLISVPRISGMKEHSIRSLGRILSINHVYTCLYKLYTVGLRTLLCIQICKFFIRKYSVLYLVQVLNFPTTRNLLWEVEHCGLDELCSGNTISVISGSLKDTTGFRLVNE